MAIWLFTSLIPQVNQSQDNALHIRSTPSYRKSIIGPRSLDNHERLSLSIYGAYQPAFAIRFHLPPINHDITLSKVKIEGPGTYNALYCSPTLSSEDIVKQVTRGLFHLPYTDLIHQGYESLELKSCQSSIQTLSKNFRQSQIS